MPSYTSGAEDLHEIVVFEDRHTMSVAAATQDQRDTIAHNLGVSVFVDYMISVDGGVTFQAPLRDNINAPRAFIHAAADENNVYFVYHNSSSPSTDPAYEFVIAFRLFVTEASR